jgi:hypothetical protein
VNQIDGKPGDCSLDRPLVVGVCRGASACVVGPGNPWHANQLAGHLGSFTRNDDRPVSGCNDGPIAGQENLLGAADGVRADWSKGIGDLQRR